MEGIKLFICVPLWLTFLNSTLEQEVWVQEWRVQDAVYYTLASGFWFWIACMQMQLNKMYRT